MKICRIIVPFLIVYSVFGCESTPTTTRDKSLKDSGTVTRDSISKLQTSIVLDSFKNLPKEMAGCGCYFAETKNQFANRYYIFAASYDSIAFISINKELVGLKLLSTTRKPGTFGDTDRVDIFSNNTYKVTVDIKYKEASGEEVWWNDGTIHVETKDGGKVTKKFVGECGC